MQLVGPFVLLTFPDALVHFELELVILGVSRREYSLLGLEGLLGILRGGGLLFAWARLSVKKLSIDLKSVVYQVF